MINAIRTALLNYSGSDPAVVGAPGEEYVPPEFIQRAPDALLSDLWLALTGPVGGRHYRNYVVDQLLSVAHNCGYDALIRARDPRVTYNPSAGKEKWGQYDSQPRQAGDARVMIFGDHQPSDSLGLSGGMWQINFTDSYVVVHAYSAVPATPSDQVPSTTQYTLNNETTTQLDVVDGLSQVIPLYGTTMTMRISFGLSLAEGIRLTQLAAPLYGSQAFGVLYAGPYGQGLWNATTIVPPPTPPSTTNGTPMQARVYGPGYNQFTYYPLFPYTPQLFSSLTGFIVPPGSTTVIALSRPNRSIADAAAAIAARAEMPLIFNRTPEGRAVASAFNPRGPVWSVIGPAVVAIGYAMLDSPTA